MSVCGGERVSECLCAIILEGRFYIYVRILSHGSQLGDLYGNDQLGSELSLDYWCVSEGPSHGGRKHHSNHKQVNRSSTWPSHSPHARMHTC